MDQTRTVWVYASPAAAIDTWAENADAFGVVFVVIGVVVGLVTFVERDSIVDAVRDLLHGGDGEP